MSWDISLAAETFDRYRAEWDALNRALYNHILLDSGFVGPSIRHFGRGRVWLARNADRGAIALLVRNRPFGWETFQPAQTPLGLIVLGQRDETGGCLRDLLHHLPGHCLQFGVRQQDPDYSAFRAFKDEPDFEVVDYTQTARLHLRGTFEEFWKSRGQNLRHNLARRRRRIAEQGSEVRLVACRTPAEVDSAIQEYGVLETLGWKAAGGTAVSIHNEQGRFYRDIFTDFCARGEGVIYQWKLNGVVAASNLCLARDRMMVVLKTAYNEEYAQFSPGFMMQQDIVQRLYEERQVRIVEFYGRLREWHTRWTQDVRQMFHLNCFRHAWVPRVKQLLRRFR